MTRAHLINRNGCVAGDLALRQGARRENILYGSLSDEQRRRSAKDRATLRAEFWRAAGSVTPQSSRRVGTAMLLRRALPAARQNSARPVPIYEMGSSSRKSTAAFTLTEILIAVVITTMIVVMLGTIFVGLTGTSLRANQRMDAFRDARGALSMMRRDVSNLVRAVPTAYFALADQYNDPNTASTKNRQLYALTSIKSGVGDLCAVGYYCRWDSTKHAYTLCRYFSGSAATLAILQSNVAGIYAPANKLFIPAASDETVAAYVWNLQITAYKTDGTVDNTYPLIIDPSNPLAVLPAALEISFDVISPQAAQGMLNASSTPNDWMDSTTTNYKRFIAPHAYEFRSRINF